MRKKEEQLENGITFKKLRIVGFEHLCIYTITQATVIWLKKKFRERFIIWIWGVKI